MTLCMLDGFDHQTGYGKWDTSAGINYGGGRTGPPGGTSLALGGNTSFRGAVRYYLDATKEDDVLIVGVAVNNFSLAGLQDILQFLGDYVSGAGFGSGTPHITVSWKDSATGFAVYRGTNSGTLLGSYRPVGWTGTSWLYLEVRVKLHDTVGEIQLRIDETQVINLTGIDTKNAGTAGVLNAVDAICCNGGGSVYSHALDDLYICNEQGAVNNTFIGNVRVEALYPNGNGAASAWVGSDGNSVDNYLLIDDWNVSLNLSDYIASSVVDDKDLHLYLDSAFNVGRPVRGVMATAWFTKDDNNPRSVRFVARDAGGVEAESADQTLFVAWSVYTKIWELQPSGTAWTVAAVNGAQFGVKTR